MLLRLLSAALLCLGLTSPAAATPDKPPILISGVLLQGFLPGTPGDDVAIRLINTDLTRSTSLAGMTLTDAFTPRKRRASQGRSPRDTPPHWELATDPDDAPADSDPDAAPEPRTPRRGRPAGDQRLTFPKGTTLPPGGELWVAATATGFRATFGAPPAFETHETDPTVPNVHLSGAGFLWIQQGYGTVALLDPAGSIIDFVAWQGPKQDNFAAGSFDAVPWSGPPVDLAFETPYGWRARVLARARDEAGHALPDTDRSADWPIGFWTMKLGAYPTHRVERPGQSHFVATPLRDVRAKILATSAPDNNFATLLAAFARAKRSIRIRVYEFTNLAIVDALIRAKRRGIDVLIYLEGSPVGGLSDQGRYVIAKLRAAKIPVALLSVPDRKKRSPRFRFDHSKYVLIDDRLAIIGTENYGSTGVPESPTFGNRGWMVHIEEPAFVRQLRAVWDTDYQPGVRQDTLVIEDAATLPVRDPAFTPRTGPRIGGYHKPSAPLQVSDRMTLELVLSPDTSLNEHSSIIGLIQRAQHSLILEQNSVPPFWGRVKAKGDSFTNREPALPLQAVIAAARRGVRVRVLLDGTWYNAEQSDERDNDDTVELLNRLREEEGLDIAAKVINLNSSDLSKIHAKGVIVDEREVFVGSINWSENSFLGNREVGVIISHPQVAGYYASLFARDWAQSTLYHAPLSEGATLYDAPADNARAIGSLPRGARVAVVHEQGQSATSHGWVEIARGLSDTAFIPASALGPIEITPWEAGFVVGREVTLTGTIQGIKVGREVTTLGLGDAERPPVIAAIFNRDLPAFQAAGLTPGEAFIGKRVRLRGSIKIYGIPEIILNRPDQFEWLPERKP